MATTVLCPKCNKRGSLQLKKTKHGTYWRVAHYIGLKGKTRKIKWCYLKRELRESLQKQLITQNKQVITQQFTQIPSKPETSKSPFSNEMKAESKWAGSSVWNERLTCTQEDAGSNPARSTWQ